MSQNSTFNVAERIIRQAMENCGLLGQGEDPNSEQFAKYTNRLNDIINFIQIKGVKFFAQQTLTPTLNLNQAVYAIEGSSGQTSSKPLRVIDSYLTDANGGTIPLNANSWQEYNRLSQKSQTGTPNSYFVQVLNTSLQIALWPVPDSVGVTYTWTIVCQRSISDVTSLVDAMDFPQEWFLALSWALADDISTGQPAIIMQRCAMKAAEYLQVLEDWDVEQTQTRLVMDSRYTGRSSYVR